MTFLKSSRKRFFQFIWLFIAMLLLMSPLAWLSVSHPQHVQSIGEIISHHTFIFMCFRWLLILGVFLLWQLILSRIGMRHGWPPEKIQFWHNQRFKIIVWLMLFELMLCDNLLLKAIHLLEGLSQ